MLGYQLIRKYELKLNDEIIPVTVEGSNEGKLSVTINDTEFTVRVTDADRSRGVFHVAVGDRELTLHVTPQPDSQDYKITLNKRDYTAVLKPILPEPSSITSAAVSTTSRSPGRAQTSTASTHAAAELGAVVAPLPGRIIEVRVKEGDNIQAGDVVIVLEAMKMANEIRAAQAGLVSKVHVQAGTAVVKGQPLVTIS